MKIPILNLFKKHAQLYILRLFISFCGIFFVEFLEWLTNHQHGGWLNAGIRQLMTLLVDGCGFKT